jgi:hypothetical protein
MRVMISITLSAMFCTQGFTQNWLHLNNGLGCQGWNTNQVSDLHLHNGHLYARGYINRNYFCDEIVNIADWNGSTWDSLLCNNGIGGGGGLASYNGKLYTTGSQICADDNVEGTLLSWNGSNWENISIDPESSGTSYDMLVHDDKLYVAGTFGPIGGQPYDLLFSYDGEQIVPLIESCQFANCGSVSFDVGFGNALAFYHDTLYVAGKFNHFDPNSRIDNIATVYDSSLHKVGVGLEYGLSIVEALCVHRDTLFIGGLFLQDNVLGNQQMTTLLYYANGHLGVYGVHSVNRITAMQSYNNELYIAGWFQNLTLQENGIVQPCQGLAKLNGHNLTVLNNEPFDFTDGIPTQSDIRDLDIINDTLYISGAFVRIGYDSTHFGGVAKMNMALADVGIEEGKPLLNSGTIQLFPNPTSNQISISGLYPHKNYNIYFYDSSGRVLATHIQTAKNTFSVDHLQNGVYFISIVSDELVCQMRFLKE